MTYDAAPSELARRHEPPIYRSSVRDQGLQWAEATKVKSAMKKTIPETSGMMTSVIAEQDNKGRSVVNKVRSAMKKSIPDPSAMGTSAEVNGTKHISEAKPSEKRTGPINKAPTQDLGRSQGLVGFKALTVLLHRCQRLPVDPPVPEELQSQWMQISTLVRSGRAVSERSALGRVKGRR